MTLPIKNALEVLNKMGGWRVLIMLPPESANIDDIVEAMPWVHKRRVRPGTLMYRFRVDQGLGLVTGGVLTEEEGTRLFSLHDQLKGAATKMFVIPPPSAPASLIARMYDSSAAPGLPVAEELPNPRVWSDWSRALSIILFSWSVWEFVQKTMVEMSGGRIDPSPISARLFRTFLGGIALFCAAMWWRRKRQLRDILEEPVRMAIMAWTPTLPPFGNGTKPGEPSVQSTAVTSNAPPEADDAARLKPAAIASRPITARGWLMIVGGLIVLLLVGGGGSFYLHREHGLDERARAWGVRYEIGESLTLDIHGVPAGGRITVLGKENACDDHCRIKFSRREVGSGQLEIPVALDWNGRSVRKSVKREPFKPLVTFEKNNATGPKERIFCDIPQTANNERISTYVKREHGLTLHAQGAPGDTVVIGGRAPDEPGEGKDYSFSENDLLGMLALVESTNDVKSINIVLPLSVQSSDGAGWESALVCKADMLGGYMKVEREASRLSAHASSTPKAGALVVGDALFFAGEGSSPWDARIVAIVDQREVLSRTCKYYDGNKVSYHWYEHRIRTQELRTGAVTGTKSFTAKPGSWTCPESATFWGGETSRSKDIVPSAEEEASWLASLMTH